MLKIKSKTGDRDEMVRKLYSMAISCCKKYKRLITDDNIQALVAKSLEYWDMATKTKTCPEAYIYSIMQTTLDDISKKESRRNRIAPQIFIDDLVKNEDYKVEFPSKTIKHKEVQEVTDDLSKEQVLKLFLTFYIQEESFRKEKLLPNWINVFKRYSVYKNDLQFALEQFKLPWHHLLDSVPEGGLDMFGRPENYNNILNWQPEKEKIHLKGKRCCVCYEPLYKTNFVLVDNELYCKKCGEINDSNNC